jgi:hypothetical protein
LFAIFIFIFLVVKVVLLPLLAEVKPCGKVLDCYFRGGGVMKEKWKGFVFVLLE